MKCESTFITYTIYNVPKGVLALNKERKYANFAIYRHHVLTNKNTSLSVMFNPIVPIDLSLFLEQNYTTLLILTSIVSLNIKVFMIFSLEKQKWPPF